MKPDRSNYEIWFLDWLDGYLSDQQARELMIFLNENPELRKELESVCSVRLSPENVTFRGAEHLRKSPEDLTPSHIEYLGVTYLENDLGPVQHSELMTALQHDNEKKRAFDLIQKVKLLPPHITFDRKNKLIKLTSGERIFRIAVTVISTAAAIALLMLAYYFIPDRKIDNAFISSGTTETDTLEIIYSGSIFREDNSGIDLTRFDKFSGAGVKSDDEIPSAPGLDYNQINIEITGVDEMSFEYSIPEISISGLLSGITLTEKKCGNSLIAHSTGPAPLPVPDNRSNVERFIARIFNEKILNDKTLGDKPVKAYEVAEAGIAGLNKILGWEMALIKNSDDDGLIKSVYFNSKIIKFNAPVKKANPAL